MRRQLLIPLLAALSLAAVALPAQALNGCPSKDEFTLDSCVLCLPGYSHKITSDTGDGGKPCYICAKNGTAAQEPQRCADPIRLPADAVLVEPAFFEPAGH